MGFNCGIVGLPNVGKSTLFNALTKTAAAQAANYPFCTIEPNVGRVIVPDERLEQLAAIAGSQNIIPTFLEVVDIAGLVRGASKGEGLGNQFLANIRQVDAILHVLRCFEDEDITHVEGTIDPIRDAETIETELLLADYESLERRKAGLEKKARSGDNDAKIVLALIDKILALFAKDKPAREIELTDIEQPFFRQLQLLTSKPIVYVCNVEEKEAADGNAWTQKVKAFAEKSGNKVVIISAAIEAEIASLESEEEKAEFLQSLGLKETGLAQVVRQGYQMLDLVTFFTVGPKEARAWTVRAHALAPEAAGVIHNDFERGFIRAETISFQDYIACKGEQEAKATGKMRQEGRDYEVQDGDVFHFRFNV